jgi:uncharacterized protein DUF6345
MPHLEIGVTWCSIFKRPGVFAPISFRALKYAYRAPSLFASKMTTAGYPVRSFACDEELRLAVFDGSVRTIHDEVDFLYFASHGRFEPTGCEAFLHLTDWLPLTTGVGKSKLKIIVFDTCEMIIGSRDRTAEWSKVNMGPNVRMILGFDGSAASDQQRALRGLAFAEALLQGRTIAYSWIKAVRSTSTSQYSRAVAIGLGDDDADAQSVLRSATLAAIPGVRTGNSLSFAYTY